MEYNTKQTPLKLPEYGRLVQQMVENALAIEDRDERTAYAKEIIALMTRKAGKAADTQKLWDHLAYIADYQLDIDYPVEIQRHEFHTSPEPVPYPSKEKFYREFGRLLEQACQQAAQIEDPDERKRCVDGLKNRMSYLLKKKSADDMARQRFEDFMNHILQKGNNA